MSDFWNEEPTEAAQEEVVEETAPEQVEETPKAETKASKKPKAEPSSAYLFKRGDAGLHVKKMQESLLEMGYNVPTSGRFCARTEAELKMAQKSLGLQENGLLDEPTCSALCK